MGEFGDGREITIIQLFHLAEGVWETGKGGANIFYWSLPAELRVGVKTE